MTVLTLAKPAAYGRLIKRYKRFLADIELASGEVITAHCPNPGRMLTCSDPGSRVRLTHFTDGKRKYPYRLDLVHNGTHWIGVNPNLANDIVWQAIQQGHLFHDLALDGWQREVPYADKRRVDFLHDTGKALRYVEVKSVTYADAGVGLFPDAVSKRASDHLAALGQMVGAGHQAVVVYCVQRADVKQVLPAEAIDPVYAVAVKKATDIGVQFMSISVDFDDSGNSVLFC